MSAKFQSIAIVIPYFGSWPFWIELFLESCRKNPTIDWYLFSDCGRLDTFPRNVQYNEVSFDEYKGLVSSKLSIRFNPESAYKLCDIKPALGLIHEDLIQGYDFWGFGDLDLVYGDLRSLYTKEYLAKYDLYSNHATRVSGHLCLIRNTEEMRKVFKNIPNWEGMFASDLHLAVDEKAFSKLFVKHKNFPNGLRSFLQNFYPLSRRSDFIESYTTPNGCIAWHDGSYNFPTKWYWTDGVISNNLNNDIFYPYFHFAIWKKDNWKNVDTVSFKEINLDCKYEISSTGIREMNADE